MDYKKMAEAALEERAKLLTELRSVNDDKTLTPAEKQARSARLTAEIAAKQDEARSYVEQGEKEAEVRTIAAASGNLVVPSAGTRTEVRANVPLPKGAGFANLTGGAASTRQFGEFVRRMMYGLPADDEARSLGGDVPAEGGWLVPKKLSAGILDLARNKARVVEAGASVIPMDAREVTVAKLTGDAVPAFRNERDNIAQSTLTFDGVTFKAKSLAVIVKASEEVLDDVDALGETITEELAKVFAIKLDGIALYGSGADPIPRGLKNVAGVTITSLGANGGTMTSWDKLMESVEAIRTANYDPTGILYAERTHRILAQEKDTAGQYLAPPTYLDTVPRYPTGQVPTNLTQGTANNASDAFVGDWKHLGIGVRQGFKLQPLRELYADSGEIGFKATLRCDVQVTRADAFRIISGITP